MEVLIASLLRRRTLGVVLAILGWACGLQAAPSIPDSLEYAVKGAYLLKFGEFVDWPPGTFPSSEAPFVIVVVGDDAFGSSLEQIALQKTVLGRPVQVKRVRHNERVVVGHIVFVGRGELERFRQIAENLRYTGALTVTESDSATEPSGIVNFVIRDNRVRFEIDAEAAEVAGLKISSKILSLAVAVKSPRR